MIIGCDIDGVLADFNTSFIKRVISITGCDLFPSRPFDIPTWDYPEFYGYTKDETSAVWKAITADEYFWENLAGYEDAIDVISRLFDHAVNGHADVYFITSRPGIEAKYQTEQWLQDRAYGNDDIYDPVPTVLISSAKGLCAQALKLDAYVDDRWENCVDVATTSPKTKVFLLDRPWNRGNNPDAFGMVVVDSATDFLNRL